MSGLLADVFSFGDTLKRKAKGLLADPAGSIAQWVNNENDRARQFNQLTSAATDEATASMRSGKGGMGPSEAKLAGLLAEGYNPAGLVSVKGPQAEALETARKNAVKMLGLPENNTPMDRAKALGFDTEAFHATGADFRSFIPNPYRGAVSVAATPQGAKAGGLAGAADGTGTGANNIMPLLMKSDGIQGLRLEPKQIQFLQSLPEKATEAEVDALMSKAPRGSFWGNFFDEVQQPDGAFTYVRKSEPKVSFLGIQKTHIGADGRRIPNWGDERHVANRIAADGGKGWIQADEAGASASIIDPSILRSRFAAFDPARVNENDLLGGATLPMLGLLGAGAYGLGSYMQDR